MESEGDARSSSTQPLRASVTGGTPPVDQPARGARKQWPQSLYLLYNHYRSSDWSDSLFKIDLPGPNSVNSTSCSDPQPTPLYPTLVFSADAHFPADMQCARLGSKVYFLGGQVLSEDAVPEGVFPRDVYVLDLANAGACPTPERLEARLKAGKPSPCVFAADGRVYALGSSVLMRFTMLPKVKFHDFGKLSAAMWGKSFECYDPKDGEWCVLEEPPVDCPTWWVDCCVLERHRLVLFSGWQGVHGNIQMLYDISRGRWIKLGGPGYYMVGATTEFDQQSHAYSMYGINTWGLPFKCCLKMKETNKVTQEEEIDGGHTHGIQQVVGDPGDFNASAQVISAKGEECTGRLAVFRDLYLESVSRVNSLGNGYYCHVVAGALGRPEGPDQWGDLPPDPCSRGVRIIVFKEIPGGNRDVQFNQGREQTSGELSFFVQVLYSKQYFIKTDSDTMGFLANTFVVSHDQERKMKKNMKRKMKKNNKNGKEGVAKE